MGLADHDDRRRRREQSARAGLVHLLRIGVDDRHGGKAPADVVGHLLFDRGRAGEHEFDLPDLLLREQAFDDAVAMAPAAARDDV